MAEDDHVGVGEWLIFHIIVAIPVLNLIMLIYWACSSSTKISKQNFVRSYLILLGVGILTLVSIAVFAAGSVPLLEHVREFSRERAQQAQSRSHDVVESNEVIEPAVTQPGEVKPTFATPEFRNFTSLDGWSMQGRVIGIDGSVVQIIRSDGSAYTASIELFSLEDQAYLNDWTSQPK